MKKKYRNYERYVSLKFRKIYTLTWVKFLENENFQNLKLVFSAMDSPKFETHDFTNELI